MILNFRRDFLTVGGQENIFLSASTCRSQFVATGPAKILKIGQLINMILNMDFALSGEIIHDHKILWGK